MFPFTAILWRVAPKLQFMQFPWRWLLCLSMVLTLFVVFAFRQWAARGALCLGLLLVVILGGRHFQPPWWDTTDDLREMQDNMYTAAGYEGTDEYTPAGADPSAIDKDARRVTVDGPEHAAIRVQKWNAESKAFLVEMSAPSRLAVRLFNYPAWRVEVNGRVVQAEARAGTGQMLVPVEAGTNRVLIVFARTWDRALGGWISIVSLLCLLAWFAVDRRRAKAA